MWEREVRAPDEVKERKTVLAFTERGGYVLLHIRAGCILGVPHGRDVSQMSALSEPIKTLGMAPSFLLTWLDLTLRWPQIIQSLYQVGCEYLWCWKSLYISGQPVPVFNQPCWLLQPVSRSVCAKHKENMKTGVWVGGCCLYIYFSKKFRFDTYYFDDFFILTCWFCHIPNMK